MDIAVEQAFDFFNLPMETLGSRRFCVYVTLQQQMQRSSWCKMEKSTSSSSQQRQVLFNENLSFSWFPYRSVKDSNKLTVEVWCKRPLVKDCVGVAWVDLRTLSPRLRHQQPLRLELCGSFEQRKARMIVVLTPTNFDGAALQPSTFPSGPQQHQQQQPFPQTVVSGYTSSAHQQPPQSSAPMCYAEALPVEDENPWSSQPVYGRVVSREVATNPPSAPAPPPPIRQDEDDVSLTRPPPLYSRQHRG